MWGSQTLKQKVLQFSITGSIFRGLDKILLLTPYSGSIHFDDVNMKPHVTTLKNFSHPKRKYLFVYCNRQYAMYSLYCSYVKLPWPMTKVKVVYFKVKTIWCKLFRWSFVTNRHHLHQTKFPTGWILKNRTPQVTKEYKKGLILVLIIDVLVSCTWDRY